MTLNDTLFMLHQNEGHSFIPQANLKVNFIQLLRDQEKILAQYIYMAGKLVCFITN